MAKQCGLSNQKTFIMNYFDYFHKVYGDPVSHISKYQFFLHVEARGVMGIAEVEFFFYYRVDSDNVLEIITSHDEDKMGYTYDIAGRFQLHEPFHQGLLKNYIREFIWGVHVYNGLDYKFHRSSVMSEKDIMDILDDILADLSIGEYKVKAIWGDSPMVKLCDEFSMHIFPSGEEDHIAECMCPTGRSHRIGINLESGSWYCGYCRINGHVEELRGYLIEYKSP